MNKTTKILIIAAIVIILTTATTMGVSAKALDFIKSFEGEKLRAYRDTGNIWSIGYGSTYNHDAKRKVQEGDIITKETALRWLKLDAGKFAEGVKKLVKVPINQNQLDSLTSFAYNLGLGSLQTSTLLKKLNAGSPKTEVAAEFFRWNKGRNKAGILEEIPGLTIRRKAEHDLFLS
jgi:GH24 family phage-related lysozyme (muramidase)